MFWHCWLDCFRLCVDAIAVQLQWAVSWESLRLESSELLRKCSCLRISQQCDWWKLHFTVDTNRRQKHFWNGHDKEWMGEQISNLNIVIEIRGLIQSKGNEWSTSRQNEKFNLNNCSNNSCSKTFPPSVEYKRRYFVLVTIKLLFVFHTMKVNGYHQAFSCNLSSFVFKRRNSYRLNLLKVSILRKFLILGELSL